jgi:hypothetical protein
MAYRGQFQTWAPGRCLVDLKSKSMYPDIFDLHHSGAKSYGLYAWNFKKGVAGQPSITNSEVQNKLYNASLLVNDWIILNIIKGRKEWRDGY